MFFMPFFYLKELDATFVDKTVHYHAWIRFIDTLRRDWENTITPVGLIDLRLRILANFETMNRLQSCYLRTLGFWPFKVWTTPDFLGAEPPPRYQAISPPYSACRFTSHARSLLGATDIMAGIKPTAQ